MNDHHLPIHASRPLWLVIRLIFFSITLGSLTPQVAAEPDQRALDPSDIFFQAWLTIRDAEKLEQEKKYSDAWRKYNQAAKYYDVLYRLHTNWKPHLVASRIKSTAASIKEIEPKVTAELKGKETKTHDLVEGGTKPNNNQAGTASGNARIPAPTHTPKAPIATPRIAQNPADKAVQHRLQTLETDNKRLREQLIKLQQQPSRKGSTAEEKRLVDKIAQRDQELNTLRNILARAPLQQDMDDLTRQNRTFKAEIDITARTLKKAQTALSAANKTKKQLQEKADLATKRAEEIQKNMDTQKKIDNQVVAQLRKELDSITSMLQSTRQELRSANEKAVLMQRTLEESQATIQELTEERNALRTERDALANILKQNGSSGIQKLIAENMRLGKELKETEARLDLLKRDNNSTKDELIEAKRDLAIAKTRIINYQQERSNNNNRIKTLERRLRDAEADLLTARSSSKGTSEVAAKSEETEILRATVKRLITMQERQRTATQILWETYQQSQAKIPGFGKIIDEIRNAKVKLTKEEQVLMASRRPDSEFTSPERVSLSHARTHATALEKEITTYNPLMKRAFEKGRFEAARQILQDMDERFPGHFPTLCNRGVVELKTEQYDKASEFFSEAITMRENSSYAHHMLGLSLYEQKDWDGARNSFQRSLELQPDNAKAHLYLGNLAGAGRRYQQAEQHFLTTIKLDSTLTEAYYNLSVIYLQQKKKKKASDYYTKALENGLSSRPEYEMKLAK